jgi:hypothetical protein
MINYQDIKDLIDSAINDLIREDKSIFSVPNNDNDENERKLHEVCINHRFACHLEKHLSNVSTKRNLEKLYVDIEVNKRGTQQKKVATVNGIEEVVRPDIMIHNRKDEAEKNNILVIEAKKHNIPQHDIDKVKGLMNDQRFNYTYGLTISYCKDNNHVIAFLYRKSRDDIVEEHLIYPTNS